MDTTQRDYDRMSKPPVRPHLFEPSGPEDICYVCGGMATDHTAPRGLARLDAAGLVQLRAIILRVIDDGDPACRNWRFYEGPDHTSSPDEWVTEAAANAQRLDFCDAIQAAIVAATTPATQPRYRPTFWQKTDDPLTCRQCDQHRDAHSASGQLCPSVAAAASATEARK